MRHPTKHTAPFSILKAVLSVALLCAALSLSLVFSTPASAQEEEVECPNLLKGADSYTRYFWRDGLWCYVGADEPAVQFYSSTPGSASNMTWALVLPTEGSSTNTFSNYWHFQLDLALCDPNSTNQNRVGACTPNSDANIAAV